MSTGTNDPPAKKVAVSETEVIDHIPEFKPYKGPPPQKVVIGEAEVVDPHLRLTFPPPVEWEHWTPAYFLEILQNLRVKLKCKGVRSFIRFRREHEIQDYEHIAAPFEEADLKDDVNYYNLTYDCLTLYISFADKDFPRHADRDWWTTVKLYGKAIEGYKRTVIPYRSGDQG